MKNKTSMIDDKRYDKIERISEEDEILMIENDNILTLGKEKDDLHAIIRIPKTENRATDDDMTRKKLIEDRKKTIKTLMEHYRITC